MQRFSIYTSTDHFLAIQNSINAAMQRFSMYTSAIHFFPLQNPIPAQRIVRPNVLRHMQLCYSKFKQFMLCSPHPDRNHPRTCPATTRAPGRCISTCCHRWATWAVEASAGGSVPVPSALVPELAPTTRIALWLVPELIGPGKIPPPRPWRGIRKLIDEAWFGTLWCRGLSFQEFEVKSFFRPVKTTKNEVADIDEDTVQCKASPVQNFEFPKENGCQHYLNI